MKFEKGMDMKWAISLTSMLEIQKAIDDGIHVTVGRSPVRAIKKANVEYIYNDSDMQEEYGRKQIGWLVDLGTDGIAGHGYDDNEHWYFCPHNTVFDDCLMFQCPANIREGDWRGDGVEILSCDKEIINIGEWKAPTKCGCII